MIWLIALIMALGTGLIVIGPLVRASAPQSHARSAADYKMQIAQIDVELSASDVDNRQALSAQKRRLQRGLLALTSDEANAQSPMRRGATALLMVLTLGAAALYAGIGTPRPPAQQAAALPISESEQAQMIAGMVQSLSEKLDADPQNIDGWIRLMRSRLVLGQGAEARADLERIEAAFPDNRETVTRILDESGWLAAAQAARDAAELEKEPIADPPQ